MTNIQILNKFYDEVFARPYYFSKCNRTGSIYVANLINDENIFCIYSYQTCIVVVKNKSVFVNQAKYSQTTGRILSLFLNNFKEKFLQRGYTFFYKKNIHMNVTANEMLNLFESSFEIEACRYSFVC